MTTFQDNKTFSEFVQSIPFEPLVFIEERKRTVMSAALQVMQTEFEPSEGQVMALRPWFDNNSAYWWVSDVDGNDNDHWIGNIAFDTDDVVHCYTPMFKSWAEFGKINQGTYEPEGVVSETRRGLERPSLEDMADEIQGERDLDEAAMNFDLDLPEPPTWNAQQVLKFLSDYLFASVGVDEWDSAKDSDQWYDEIVVFVGDMLEMDLAVVHASINTDQAWIKRQNELRHNTISDLMTQHEDEMGEMARLFIQMAHNTTALKPLNRSYQAMQRRHFNEMAEIIEPTVL